MLPSFIYRSKRKSDEHRRGIESCETLTFSPERIVAAIAYHLIDEEVANAVEAAGCAAAVSKLSRRITTLTIIRRQWVSMSNAQRLNWLMAQGRVSVRSRPDGSAILSVR